MILCFNVMKIKNEINIVNKILPQVFGLLVLSCPEKIFVNSVPSCVWRDAWEDVEKGDKKSGHVLTCCPGPLIGGYFYHRSSCLYMLPSDWSTIVQTEAVVFTT